MKFFMNRNTNLKFCSGHMNIFEVWDRPCMLHESPQLRQVRTLVFGNIHCAHDHMSRRHSATSALPIFKFPWHNRFRTPLACSMPFHPEHLWSVTCQFTSGVSWNIYDLAPHPRVIENLLNNRSTYVLSILSSTSCSLCIHAPWAFHQVRLARFAATHP